MKFVDIPRAVSRKPRRSTAQRPQPLQQTSERQLLKKPHQRSCGAMEEKTGNTQGHMAFIESTKSKSGGVEHSNKHVTTSRPISTTSNRQPSVQLDRSKEQEQSETVNANLITDDMAALITKTRSKPTLSPGFCDRLTITFGDQQLDSEDLSMALHDLEKKTKDNPYLVSRVIKSSYSLNYWIKSPTREKLALLQMKSKLRSARFARLDFNPAAIGEEGVRNVQQVMAMLFGDDYRTLIGCGRITRLDASVDIFGQHTKDLIAYTAYPRKVSVRPRPSFQVDAVDSE